MITVNLCKYSDYFSQFREKLIEIYRKEEGQGGGGGGGKEEEKTKSIVLLFSVRKSINAF